jgi:signal transduction histidine kinase
VGGPAARSLALRLFGLVAVLSIMPLVLAAYLDSNDRHAREQIMLALRGRSTAIAHAFVEQLTAEAPKPPLRGAQLAGFGAEAGSSVSRPPLPTPAPPTAMPPAPMPPVPAPVLDPHAAEVVRTSDPSATGLGPLAPASYWQSAELRLAVIAYLILMVVAIGVAFSVLRSLKSFRSAAYEIVLGRVGDNALMARNGVRELSGVALLLDRLVFDLRYMSDQMRLTAAENAHSLRTPLATMRTALGAIKRSLPTDEPRAQRALKIIDLSLDRLSSVVNAAQRNDTTMANLVAAPRSPVDLTELMHDVIGELEERARLGNIRLRHELKEGIVVSAVAPALKLALLDTIASAINASVRYGEVAIELRHDGTTAQTVVDDRGANAEHPELFFQHDFQPAQSATDTASANELGSTRLCLWNVKRTVQAFGGEVDARRNAHGGASVSIALPCELQ